MRIILSLFAIMILFGCSSNKTVYWCGDHQCLNKKEKEAYFKKTMIVEVREVKKIESNEKSEIEAIKELAKKNEKRRIMDEKELKKQAKLEQKRKIMEEKELKKQAKLQEKRRINEEKKLEEQSMNQKKGKKDISKDLSKKEKIVSANNKVVLNQSNFEKIVEEIIYRNSLKPYPEINEMPN